MATARKRTTASSTSGGNSSDITNANPRLELAKAINALSQKMEAFGKAAEGLASFTKDTLVEFDLQIQAKNEDLARLAEENDHTQKRLKTETTLFLAEFRYDGAKKVLSERNEMPVSVADYEQMKATLTRLTAEREKDVESAVKHEKERARAALESAVQMRELNHKAQTAELTAGQGD